MKSCFECGHMVADAAKVCPKCGAKKPGQPAFLRSLDAVASGAMGIGCLIILLPLLVVLAIALFRIFASLFGF